MAAPGCATFSSLSPSVNPTAATRTKPLVAASLRKPTRRKNSLRPKILKTLTKPSLNPVIPIISPETKTETHLDFESLTEQVSGDTKAAADPGEGDKVEEFRVSETSAKYDGIFGKLSAGSVLKYGAYFVGIFVLQTVCSVWIMGSGNSDRKERNLDSSSTESNKGKLFANKNGIISGASNAVFAHDSELERKIEEIRAMAREARKSEAKVEEEDDEDEDEIDEETAISRQRAGIEKEMSATLNNLQKRLDSLPEKLPGSYVNYLGKSGKIENGADRDKLDSKGSNGALMFKKKLKFRSPSTKSINGPNGFQGTGDRKVPNKKKRSSDRAGRIRGDGTVSDDGVEVLDLEQQLERRHSDNPESTYGTVKEDDEMISLTQDSTSSKKDGKVLKEERQGSNLGMEIGVGNAERRTGVVQESSLERPSVEVENLQQSAMLGSQHSPRLRRRNRETPMKSDKRAVLNRNDSSKHREVGDRMLANKFKDKQSNIETDFWWLNLPYVLVIFMRRGSDREGQAGFYNLKFGSQAEEQSNSSYTVAFEDRADASNFCFLLEDFFKDLDDFSADILPLSIKELHEAVKANAMKVVVVKKRQLQLYAGQPFADVEMALHSLVKGDQNAPMRNS
ncbi:hypothetical protein I3842_01G147000 [Carya illinoinensis]|uniref:Uncharacterized protein n=1 Tax=Carya illinoinensis TaxID=32201 RepID=A0A922G0G9_CARIL|nr:hypothetical protein I3842_01G147000 [Carya illinoinensis]